MQSTLQQSLSKWDGIHTDYLLEIINENEANSTFLDEVINIYMSYPEMDHATSWIIKCYVDNGAELSDTQKENIYAKMHTLSYWESQLHLLQIIPKIELTSEISEAIRPCIRLWMNSEKKFVKAAAYQAYFKVVKGMPDIIMDFKLMCESAMENESASIRSKVKKILMQLNA